MFEEIAAPVTTTSASTQMLGGEEWGHCIRHHKTCTYQQSNDCCGPMLCLFPYPYHQGDVGYCGYASEQSTTLKALTIGRRREGLSPAWLDAMTAAEGDAQGSGQDDASPEPEELTAEQTTWTRRLDNARTVMDVMTGLSGDVSKIN